MERSIMSRLIRTPNIPDQDLFYAELINAQRQLTDEQADLMLAKLALILSNHVGDRQILREAMTLARDNTLACAT
jgi:hypothetical protein